MVGWDAKGGAEGVAEDGYSLIMRWGWGVGV